MKNILITLTLCLLALAGRAQNATTFYKTNTFKFANTNLLRSNLVDSAQVIWIKGASGELTPYVPAGAPFTNMQYFGPGTNAGAFWVLGALTVFGDIFGGDLNSDGLAGGFALISDGTTVAEHANVTETELGYVDGVTSPIQDQLDGKQSLLRGGTNWAQVNITNYSQITWNTNALSEGTDGAYGGFIGSNFISFSATNNPLQILPQTNNQNWFLATNIDAGVRVVEVVLQPSHFYIATNRQVIFPSTFKMMSGGYTNTLWSNRTAVVTLRNLGNSMSAVQCWYHPENP